MKKTPFIQLFFFILSIILFGVGGYFYFMNQGNSIQSTAFLRAGFLFLIAACFIRQILRLPRWTDIGWLPLAAAVISWKLYLLKFAVPLSLILVFLNSPLARGKYRQKSWRELGKRRKDPARQNSETPKNGDVPEQDAHDIAAEKLQETGQPFDSETVSGPETVSGSEMKDVIGAEVGEKSKERFETAEESVPETLCGSCEGASEVKSEVQSESAAPHEGDGVKSETASAPKADGRKTERKRPSSDVRGPNAKNVMFRALSRVAGRQVGKVIQKVKEKGKD